MHQILNDLVIYKVISKQRHACFSLSKASNTFMWSNSWPVTVTFWGENEPSQFTNEEGCVLMNSGKGEDDGKWKHTTCREMHSAICKKPLSK